MLTTCIYGHSCMCCYFILFFFFSSRRRHTRYWRDWSSDVCSSDLRVARVMRGAAQEVVERDFVKAAEAVGERRSRIVFGELQIGRAAGRGRVEISVVAGLLKKKK